MNLKQSLKQMVMLGILTAPIALMTAPSQAAGQGGSTMPNTVVQKVALLDGLFDRRSPAPRQQDTTVQLAQAGDPRITNLEEQIRALNGRVEELNFLILQTQEQMRKQQEDIEFRLQELEGGSGGGGNNPPSGNRSDASPADTRTQTASVPQAAPQGAASSQTGPTASTSPNDLPGVPRNLGSIRFDANGNLIGGTVDNEPVDLLGGTQTAPVPDNSQVAALPSTDDPDELYRNSYEFILSGDYKTAEAGFRSYIDRFPSANRQPDANFWLGEALAAQKRHREAAEVFLAASRQYPDSRKAPDTLLKLGMSLSALNQREVACATFREVGQRHPEASGALKERVRQELASNKC